MKQLDKHKLCASTFLLAIALPAFAFAQMESAKVRAPIKVMSFNIRFGTANDGNNHWKHRHELVTETIQLFGPDVLGVQEALQFQCEYLESKLTGYQFFGRGRETAKTKGEYCGIFFRSDRFEKTDGGHLWLSETPQQPGSRSWDSSLPRMFTYVHLKDRKSGKSFILVNTHFDHRGSMARLKSAELIKDWVNERSDLPVILMGDFNAAIDSAPYNALAATDNPMLDTWSMIHGNSSSSEGTFGGWKGKREGARIDWILHSSGFQTLNAGINLHNRDGRYPSDHYPVQAVVDWVSK